MYGSLKNSSILPTHWAIRKAELTQVARMANAPYDGSVHEALAKRQPETEYIDAAGVGVIDVHGVLTKYAGLWSACFGGGVYTELEQAVKAATVSAEIRTILIRVDSPGGTVAGVSDLADAVYAARQVKPVVAYISDMGASAAYYVASQADTVYADEDALVGSIGTVLVVDDWSKAYDEAGVKTHVISTGKYKGEGAIGAPVKDEHLKDFQREVDLLGESFFEAVARGRGMPMEAVLEVADGRVFHAAKEAVGLGLIDAVRSFDEVLAGLQAPVAGDEAAGMSLRMARAKLALATVDLG